MRQPTLTTSDHCVEAPSGTEGSRGYCYSAQPHLLCGLHPAVSWDCHGNTTFNKSKENRGDFWRAQ
ncbi:hypothetical protein DV515_00003966, partial [Chloebia gouldiae]